MQISLLQVTKLQINKLSVEAVPGGGAQEQPIDDCEIEVFRHQDEIRTWMVALTISFGNDRQKARYVGEISLTGEFMTSETVTGEAAENLVNVNGPAILYSSAREILLGITSRCPSGSWMLPSVTFIDRKKAKPTTPPALAEQNKGATDI